MATQRICSIDGCGKPVKARGWCNAHWFRWRRHGNPLSGGTTPGDALAFLMRIDLNRLVDECIRWPFALTRGGYGQINVDGRHTYPHIFMCERINGPAPSSRHQAAHTCGKGHDACVNPFHLKWKTPTENEADKLIHDTHIRGERSRNHKLSEADARAILANKGRVTAKKLSGRYGVSRSAVLQIWSRRNWAWL